jgi:co-chaperonin GroES (HSP10)
MDLKDQIEQTVRPQALRLKELGKGLRVGRVIGNRLLVKTITDSTELDEIEKRGSLVIPKHIKKDYTPLPSKGIVVAVGEDVVHYNIKGEPNFQEGDMVLFGKYTGTDFRCNEEDLRILNAEEILCVLVDTDSSVVGVLKDE